ncbi:MAG TPA: cation diffusion facilitator family transporter [Bacillota bacterium]|nr:cation diffusion facilitator family transporter [Bacillota bacterium]
MQRNRNSKKDAGNPPLLTAYLVKRFTNQPDPTARAEEPQIRAEYAYLEAIVSIIGNLALAVIKIVFGLATNSISLLADAIHTASDVVTSLVVLVGFRISEMPADEQHPFGHGRVEFLSTLAVAGLLTYAGIRFGISSYSRFVDKVPVKGSIAVATVMLAGALFKEWMTRFALYLGEKADADALIADAWHHRTDAIASSLVAVAMVVSMYGYHWVDAVLGIAVSALIVYTGIELAVSSCSKLIGEGPSKELESKIADVIQGYPQVKGFHDVMVHDYGDRKSVSLHILMDDDLSLVESHDLATKVENALKNAIRGDVVVHFEPQMTEEARQEKGSTSRRE